MSNFSPSDDSSRDLNRRSIARFIIRLCVLTGLISVLLTVFARPLPVFALGSATGLVTPALLIFVLIPIILLFSTRRTSERVQSRRQEREEARQQIRQTLREFRDDLHDLRAARRTGAMLESEKHKNAAHGMDMYSLMDRMVDELDDEEIAYLQQKLQDRSSGEDVDLPQSIGDLLNKRAEHRLGE